MIIKDSEEFGRSRKLIEMSKMIVVSSRRSQKLHIPPTYCS